MTSDFNRCHREAVWLGFDRITDAEASPNTAPAVVAG